MIHVAIALAVLVLMLSMWERKRDDLSCRYCGKYRGHEQNCPYDVEQR